METVLDFRSFDPRFKSGLVFSAFEGLIQGQGLKVICDQDPSGLMEQFLDAGIKNVKWDINEVQKQVWEVRILKIADSGCCGICGHDKG